MWLWFGCYYYCAIYQPIDCKNVITELRKLYFGHMCVCVAIQKPPFPLISLVIANFCNTPSSSFAKGGDQVAIGLQWFTFQFNACNSLCNTIQFAVQVVFAPAQQAGNYVSITSARTLIAWRSITTLTWNRTLGIQTVPASKHTELLVKRFRGETWKAFWQTLSFAKIAL